MILLFHLSFQICENKDLKLYKREKLSSSLYWIVSLFLSVFQTILQCSFFTYVICAF